MKKLSYLLISLWLCVASVAYSQDWMPDPILRKVVRAELNTPEGTPLTKTDMQRLPRVVPARVKVTGEISNLSGLEYAVNLYSLLLGKHGVRDLRPIANLTNLRFLGFGPGPISDLTPLAGLVNLETLGIERNQIINVSPLANLINLRILKLARNQIEDFSPLAGLVNLEWLEIQRNRSSDISAIPTLKLKDFVYDETCNLPGIPIADRIENREYPSIYGVWSYVPNKPQVIPTPETSEIKPNTYFDLRVGAPQVIRLGWAFGEPDSNERVRLIPAVSIDNGIEKAKQRRDAILAFNPNAICLVAILYYSGVSARWHPEDGVLRNLYLRDKNGNRIVFSGDGEAPLDFTLPETQEFVFDQVRAVKACGLFDGIFFDHWSEGNILMEDLTGRTTAEVHLARDRIIQGVRDIIGDDMLILVNTGESKIPRWAEYINGAHMETHTNPSTVKVEGTDNYHNRGYTRADLLDIEDTLLWSEANFREPRINSLRGYTIGLEPPNSPRNEQWMRIFTTLSLTHSDGYVEYASLSGKYGPEVYWHPFYDAPLGRPVGEKGQLYQTPKGVSIEGLFIREYTNGWAVYNRSGKERRIYLSEKGSGVASGVVNKHWHTLPDLDGEIFLKQTTPIAEPSIGAKSRYDVDGDGDVDVSDVRLVVIGLGQKGKNIKNSRTDINKNEKVDKNDVLLVIDNLDAANGAPQNIDLFSPIPEDTISLLNPMILRSTLKALRLENDGSLKYQQAITYFEHLLALIRPDATRLLANYPNPFNPETWIPYHLANPSEVLITIYDARGIVVRRLALGHQQEGYYTTRSRAAYWDGRNDVGERVASGLYFYTFIAGDFTTTRKMLILK